MEGREVMNLIHKSTARQASGLYEVSVVINGKDYTYRIGSEFAIRRFTFFTRKKLFGKAVSTLNKFKEGKNG